jgi:hypothetical protein
MAKLTEDQRTDLRAQRDAGATLTELAASFGVSLSTAHAIANAGAQQKATTPATREDNDRQAYAALSAALSRLATDGDAKPSDVAALATAWTRLRSELDGANDKFDESRLTPAALRVCEALSELGYGKTPTPTNDELLDLLAGWAEELTGGPL